ncbi:MAG TPA: D-alanyl-D-alanine carboxypeptidase family protein [Saprospiraceae bacterium]|nr:D-alanyl-D-alanine carboxypeptidase family protein [Saprospiraceae bacterium]
MISSLHSLFYFIFAVLTINSCTNTEHNSTSNNTTLTVKEKDTIQYLTEIKNITQVDSTISLDYLMGKFDPSNNKSFTKIASKYTKRKNLLLRKETYEAFKKMHAAALKDGVKLSILSATRNFKIQKTIWEAKWLGTRKIENGKDASKAYPNPKTRALQILKFSSMPSTSRHHWGTDIDINNLNNSYFKKGKGLKEYQWLQKHAHDFGFFQPYTAGRPYGYQEERWHWSYLPIAKKLSDQAKLRLKNEMIQGFKGSETAQQINVVKHYVLGINQECL